MAFVSCSKSEDLYINNDNEVTITSSIATRTSVNNWEAEDEIGVFMMTHGSETFADLGKNVLHSTVNGNGLFASSTPLYFPPSDNVDLLAYYPHKTTTTDAGVHLVDVATQTDQGAIDLMTASLSNIAKTPLAIEMEFNHKLSNILLTIINGDGYADLAAIGTISKIELSGSVTSASYDLTSDDISLGSNKETIEFVVTQTSDSGSITAEALIIPQTLSDDSAALWVTTAAGAVHKVAVNGTFAIGTQYSYELKLSLTELTISGAKINDWNKTDGGELEGTPADLWDGSYPKTIDDAKATLGSTDENGVYQIGGVYTFAAIAYLINNDNNNFGDADIALNCDIDLGDEEWTPIGNSSAPFCGEFDGNNYTINGLSINSTSDQQALIGYISGNSSIKDITVDGSVTSTGSYCAGVVGYAVAKDDNSITIENCVNKATIKTDGGFSGGVVGYSYDISIKNCSNSGNITAGLYYTTEDFHIDEGNGEYMYGSSNIGGVVGYTNGTSISNCYNSGSINGTVFDSEETETSDYSGVYGSYGIGGVVGCPTYSSSVTNCYNTGSIIGEDSIGGVVGEMRYSTTVTNCYNVGSIVGNSSVGGIVGFMIYYCTVSNCYWLDTESDSGVGKNMYSTTTNVESKTETEMKTTDFVTLLNASQDPTEWQADSANQNSGYPVLN